MVLTSHLNQPTYFFELVNNLFSLLNGSTLGSFHLCTKKLINSVALGTWLETMIAWMVGLCLVVKV